jgi:hypothetical protein
MLHQFRGVSFSAFRTEQPWSSRKIGFWTSSTSTESPIHSARSERCGYALGAGNGSFDADLSRTRLGLLKFTPAQPKEGGFECNGDLRATESLCRSNSASVFCGRLDPLLFLLLRSACGYPQVALLVQTDHRIDDNQFYPNCTLYL